MKNILEQLIELLKNDSRLVADDGSLLKNQTQEFARKNDPELIKLLLSDVSIKQHFFVEVEKTLIFDKEKFIRFVSNKQFLPDSFTAFTQRVGLMSDDKYFSSNNDVVLAWPYKDCILEGGMTKEDQSRDEIFYNEVLAPDEINRLLDAKVLTNFKKIDKKGEHQIRGFVRDERGMMKENLIIRGNNLLALSTLKKEFSEKIKLIYIDPPYNTGDDSFRYNDRFNHSSWLVFMKNRFILARELLSQDGAIFVQIDLHEVGYLQVIMDEIFGKENFVQLISVKTASPAGFKTVNPGPIDVTEYIFFYTKDKSRYKFKRGYVSVDYDENYNLVITNPKEQPNNWKLDTLANIVYRENGIKVGTTAQESAKNAKAKWGTYWKVIRRQIMSDYALRNAENVVSVRDPHKPTATLKELMEESKIKKDKVLVYSKSIDEKGEEKSGYVYNGGALAFYKNKIRNISGIETPTELLTDLWSDISWDGIAGEGGVKLKNGKKPERLLQRIIEITTEKNDIVLDYHLGSGTTCAVALKMGRQFIGVEQLNYEENDCVARLKNVIDGDGTGISGSVGWEGGGDFIYSELAKLNENWLEKIKKVKKAKEISIIWNEIKKTSFLSYKVYAEIIDPNAKEFSELSVANQKKFLVECLDKNQLYINLTEIDDREYGVSEDDKKLNKEFYSHK